MPNVLFIAGPADGQIIAVRTTEYPFIFPTNEDGQIKSYVYRYSQFMADERTPILFAILEGCSNLYAIQMLIDCYAKNAANRQ